MLSRTLRCLGWHYLHPKNGRPLKQTRRFGDPRFINNEAAMIQGQWGLITSDFGMITSVQLENARLAILRRMPRNSFQLTMPASDREEFPVIRRAKESRMGGGKGNIHHFGYKLSTGVPLFELVGTGTNRLTKSQAEAIFLPAKVLIPLVTIVVPHGRVDEYNVFK